MTIEADLFAALGPLVSDRCFPIVVPLASGSPPPKPWIRYTLVSTIPAVALCGDSGDEAADTRVQIDVNHTTYAAARALRLQVMEEMREFVPPAIYQDGFDEYDSETKTFRSSLDFIVYKSVELTP